MSGTRKHFCGLTGEEHHLGTQIEVLFKNGRNYMVLTY